MLKQLLLASGIVGGVVTAAVAVTAQKEDEDDGDKIKSVPVRHQNQIPEFEKYSGHKVTEVEDLLNSVTKEDYDPLYGGSYFIISKENFEMIKNILGVYEIYIRNNYDPSCMFDLRQYGEMITFRIRENYCVSNDGFFIIGGKWKYFTADDVRKDYLLQHQCKERIIKSNWCYIV